MFGSYRRKIVAWIDGDIDGETSLRRSRHLTASRDFVAVSASVMKNAAGKNDDPALRRGNSCVNLMDRPARRQQLLRRFSPYSRM